uniref:Retrotransposon protein, putative, Ty1-copia subclass n=1 Tax=Tanacetum cinerariifolium TaxID=118510 RepID=A0A6L2MKM6_TANCI|nr:retrotransposon protein, putative, Ty1-copia subclass [Tanacetum cinerariifolium]
MMIKGGKIQKSNKKSLKAKGKGKTNGKGKGKQVYIPKPKNLKPAAKEHPAKDDIRHRCKEVGHSKRNFPAYLVELIKKKKQVGIASSSDIFVIELFSFPSKSWVYGTSCGTFFCNTQQGLRGVRKLKQIEAKCGSDDLVLPNGLVICLDNFHYAPSITRGVVSVHRLVENGFVQCFTDFRILVSKKNVFYFNVIPSNGIYEIDMHDLVPNLTLPYTPQHNGMSEKRNRTLFDMVRSMMNLTTMSLSFWDYALESAIPTKKVDKTPYELWDGKVPNLSYLKVWECEVLTHVLELSSCVYLDDRAWGVLNFASAGVRGWSGLPPFQYQRSRNEKANRNVLISVRIAAVAVVTTIAAVVVVAAVVAVVVGVAGVVGVVIGGGGVGVCIGGGSVGGLGCNAYIDRVLLSHLYGVDDENEFGVIDDNEGRSGWWMSQRRLSK